jgi:hypothetical protein
MLWSIIARELSLCGVLTQFPMCSLLRSSRFKGRTCSLHQELWPQFALWYVSPWQFLQRSSERLSAPQLT